MSFSIINHYSSIDLQYLVYSVQHEWNEYYSLVHYIPRILAFIMIIHLVCLGCLCPSLCGVAAIPHTVKSKFFSVYLSGIYMDFHFLFIDSVSPLIDLFVLFRLFIYSLSAVCNCFYLIFSGPSVSALPGFFTAFVFRCFPCERENGIILHGNWRASPKLCSRFVFTMTASRPSLWQRSP